VVELAVACALRAERLLQAAGGRELRDLPALKWSTLLVPRSATQSEPPGATATPNGSTRWRAPMLRANCGAGAGFDGPTVTSSGPASS